MKKMAVAFVSFFLLTGAQQVSAKNAASAGKKPATSTSSKRAFAKGSTPKTAAKRLKSNNTSPLKKNLTPLSAGNSVAAEPAREFVENTLLVMPYASSDEDTQDLIKEVDGTITETIGEGSMTVWVVRFKEAKKFEEAEKKLAKDKHLKSVERDAVFHSQK